MGLLDGKVAIVTGGARGQGEAEARMIVAEGGCVLIGDILADEGAAAAFAIGERARFVYLDVTDEASWAAAVAAARDAFGRLDLLINNAGYSTTTGIADVTVDELDRVYAINQKGVALGLKHGGTAIRDGGQGGAIVNISSMAALRALRGKVAYAAAKAAVKMMTEVAALEYAKDCIRVNAILPGIVDTAMVSAAPKEAVDAAVAKTPLGRLGQVDDIANAAIFLLSDKASFITGVSLPVDGGIVL